MREPTIITPTNDGPYRVEGDFAIVLPSGKRVETDKRVVYLCRCGGSQNKPFCDGTHKKIGFRASEPVVAAASLGHAASSSNGDSRT